MKLTIAVALMVAATPLLAQQPDLSGHWTFNAAQSDNPRDMLQGRDSTGDQSRGGRGGGYPGMGGGRGGFWGTGGGGVGRGGGGGGRGVGRAHVFTPVTAKKPKLPSAFATKRESLSLVLDRL